MPRAAQRDTATRSPCSPSPTLPQARRLAESSAPSSAGPALPGLCGHGRLSAHPDGERAARGGGGGTDTSKPRSRRPGAATNLYSPRRWRSRCPRAPPAALPGSRCRRRAGLSSAGVPARSPRSSSAGPPCPPGPASTRPPGTARRCCGSGSARPHPPSRTPGSSQGAGIAAGPGTSGERRAGPGSRSKMAPGAPHPVAMATRKAAGPGGTLRPFTAALCGSRWWWRGRRARGRHGGRRELQGHRARRPLRRRRARLLARRPGRGAA